MHQSLFGDEKPITDKQAENFQYSFRILKQD